MSSMFCAPGAQPVRFNGARVTRIRADVRQVQAECRELVAAEVGVDGNQTPKAGWRMVMIGSMGHPSARLTARPTASRTRDSSPDADRAAAFDRVGDVRGVRGPNRLAGSAHVNSRSRP